MSAIVSAPAVASNHIHRLSASRLLVTGGVTAALLFVLCWLGTYIPVVNPTHSYIGLFTARPVDSPMALVEGALWSLLFGALAGAVFALTYNATASLDRR